MSITHAGNSRGVGRAAALSFSDHALKEKRLELLT